MWGGVGQGEGGGMIIRLLGVRRLGEGGILRGFDGWVMVWDFVDSGMRRRLWLWLGKRGFTFSLTALMFG